MGGERERDRQTRNGDGMSRGHKSGYGVTNRGPGKMGSWRSKSFDPLKIDRFLEILLTSTFQTFPDPGISSE